MTLFAHPTGQESVSGESNDAPEAPTKRPPRWSVSNWPVRWKVLAIALVPMVLAMLFGGLRISAAMSDASQLRRAADRAEMIPAITNYMAALSNVLVVGSAGGDVQGAKKNYESRKYELQSRLAGTDVAADVKSGVTRLLDGGQALLDKVSSTGVPLRDLVAGYTLILLPAQDAINGSVRVDSERIRAETEGLSRAVGARGQMMMQELMVNRGGEMPEPMLRTAMLTVAGTEPSTLLGINKVLGVDSPDAKKLQQLFVGRMTLMSDPTSALAGNPDLLQAIHATDEIATQVIKDTTGAVTKAVEDQRPPTGATPRVRDTILVFGGAGGRVGGHHLWRGGHGDRIHGGVGLRRLAVGRPRRDRRAGLVQRRRHPPPAQLGVLGADLAIHRLLGGAGRVCGGDRHRRLADRLMGRQAVGT
ncbi:hypothetical protein C1Y40_03203 [Mycobacterium talmoniae]|uniref:Uncharacterized protein n=1 Tax=Mycobacterium talmoniae TaxID=1858794 RepID=A0A2S8BJ43_9MYCO|nr:hypothetical protein C1Y40_03203 [Mycobacterium talmoniae]